MNSLKRYNCILVYSEDKAKILFCERKKAPYQGLLNLVGGKVEVGERALESAYRELEEETGIKKSDIDLCHLMDISYYERNMRLEVFYGGLKRKVELIEEFQTLIWVDVDADFFDLKKFAGDGNIGHIVRMIEG